MRKTKEFHDILAQFERDMPIQPGIPSMRYVREKGTNLPKNVFFQDGRTNEMFLAYMAGYSFAKAVYQS